MYLAAAIALLANFRSLLSAMVDYCEIAIVCFATICGCPKDVEYLESLEIDGAAVITDCL